MFLLSRAIDRGNLRSAGISRFIARPLRSYRSPSLASASSGRLLLRWRPYSATILSIWDVFAKNLWDIFRCSPGYSNVVVLLDAVCDPGVPVGARHQRASHFACAQNQRIGTVPKFQFSGLRFRFRAYTLHLARLACLLKHQRETDYRAAD
jgi:hypothetical protein